jgi:hypothetical protein
VEDGLKKVLLLRLNLFGDTIHSGISFKNTLFESVQRILSLFIFVLVFSSCEEDNPPPPPDLGYRYFPLITGNERIYLVDSLAYDNNAGITDIDTFRYYYREQVGEIYQSGNGENWYMIYRAFADTLDGNWRVSNTWRALQNELYAQQNEDNRVFVKMVFPVKENKSWNGNMFNALDAITYRFIATEVPYNQFDNTIIIQMENDSNAIEVIRRNEQYAKDVGLVYFKYDSLNTQVSGTRGFRKQYRLIQYR